MVVRTGTLSLETGQMDFSSGKECVEIQPCDTPLFVVEHKRRGVCNSCLGGWEVERNTPTERGRQQIEDARSSSSDSDPIGGA